MTHKKQPHDPTAEQAVVGGILLDNERLNTLRGGLDPSDFFILKYRTIFTAALALSEKGEPVDAVTLGNEIGNLKKIGGAVTLSELTDAVVTTANIDHYAQIVREKAARRRMIAAGLTIAHDGYKADDTAAYLDSSRETVSGVALGLRNMSDAQRVADTIPAAYTEATSEDEPEGVIKTGFSKIDDECGGMWPGTGSILASRTSIGKSATALNIAVNAARQGKRVLLVTLEDTRRFVEFRMLSMIGGVDLRRILQRKLLHEDHPRLVEATNEISKLPIWIDDRAGQTSADIRRLATVHADRHGLDLLIVDHLGHIRDKGSSLYESTTNAARVMADIPKDLNVPLLLLHQLNRGAEYRDNKKPQLSDLRQSGEVEQLARAVWFLYRPAYYDEHADPHEMAFIVAKASHGQTGNYRLYCDLPRMYVGDEPRGLMS